MSTSPLKVISWDDAITLASPHPYVLAVSADIAIHADGEVSLDLKHK